MLYHNLLLMDTDIWEESAASNFNCTLIFNFNTDDGDKTLI